MKNQPQTRNFQWIYERGYTVSAAARKIHRSQSHVHQVLAGKRQSHATMAALEALPPRPLMLRERVHR